MLAFLFVSIQGQDRRSLEKKRSAIDEQIRTVSKLIASSKNEQKTTQADLSLIDKRISLQRSLMSTIKGEVRRAERKLKQTEDEIKALEEDMANLKESYGKMVQYAYRNRSSYDRLSYIFAAESFAQAFRRSRYLNQLAEFRRRQADLIQETASDLEIKRAMLEEKQEEKLALLSEQKKTARQLETSRAEQKKILASLREKEDELQQDLKKKRDKRKELDKRIRELIAAEIARERKKNNGTFSLTPEAIELSKKFTANKGRLPWPVERGVIVSKFGRQAHPVLKGIVIENNGVDIATVKGASMRAVFDGEISSVFVIPGAGKVVIVDHGAYRSVYSPLKEVYVSKGDKVYTKDVIGVILDEGDGSNAHLEIWKVSAEGPSKQDPSAWLLKP